MSELSERVAREHAWTLTEHIDRHGDDYFTGGCVCGAAQDADTDDESYDGGHAAHLAEVTEAAVRETIAAASPSQQWGWGTDGWKPGDPDDFLQPMTAGHNVFTEADVRSNVERFGGIAVVRTIYTAPEPGPWKEAP